MKDSKGNMKTILLEVEGPICLSGTTTKERIYEDNANRCLLIYLDNSDTQQQSIIIHHWSVVKTDASHGACRGEIALISCGDPIPDKPPPRG